ncbi:MAG: efflux RND transporter periplasmic adaptor subunit [Pseudomonadota bacterium]
MTIISRTLCALACLSFPAFAQEAKVVDLSPSGQPVSIPSVKLVEAGAMQDVPTRSFFGRIAARETVDLSFEVGGRLTEFPVIEGTRITSGDLVARLEPGSFDRAVEQAALALAQAERAVARANRLMENNVGSEVQAEDAVTARDLADVALRDALAAQADATLYAPFDALVASRLAAQFSNVEPGEPILRLHDMSEVRVEIDVPERLFQLAGTGGIAFEGVLPQVVDPIPLDLVEFDAQTGTVGQTFRVSLRLPALEIDTLIPGSSMTVRAVVQTGGPDGITLPATAIQSGADRSASVVIYEPSDEDRGIVRAVTVQVRSTSGTDLVVDGLPDGTLVVAVGGHLLSDGDVVRPYRGLSVQE